MVTVTGLKKQKNADGKEFILLEVQGDLEAVQSMRSGRFYLTLRKAYMSTTFEEGVAQTLIGKQLPGRIARVACTPYEYTIPDTGELVTLQHRWDYQPEEGSVPALPQPGVPA